MWVGVFPFENSLSAILERVFRTGNHPPTRIPKNQSAHETSGCKWVLHVLCMWVGGFSPHNSLDGTWTQHLKGESFRMKNHPPTYTPNEIQFKVGVSFFMYVGGWNAVLKQRKTKQSNAQRDKANKSTAKHVNIWRQQDKMHTHNYHKTTKNKTQQRKERKSKAQRHKAKQTIARDGSQQK